MLNIEIVGPKALVRVHHERAYDFDEKRGLWLRKQVDDDEVIPNLITNAGRVQLHEQCYETSGSGAILTNGFNWIGLDDADATPSETDTALPDELVVGVAPGLERAQGTVTVPTGALTQTTIAKTFTFTGSTQIVNMCALFTVTGPPVAGIMAHEVNFTDRTLVTNDTLTITYTITLGA